MIYDLAIIGGGPAGISAGIYAARKKLKTIFITKDWNTQSIVSSDIQNWIGEKSISGLELSKRLKEHLEHYSKDTVEIVSGETCISLNQDKSTKIFGIKTVSNNYEAKSILIATGSHRRKLNIPGSDKFEHRGLTYCASCDGLLYSGMDVIVIGGGNAAFESASQLLAYCKSVTLLNRSESFRADNVTVEAVSKHPNFKIIKDAIPVEVLGNTMVEGLIYEDALTREKKTLSTSGIFVEIGALPNTDFAKNFIDIDQYGKIITNPKNQRTSVSGIWSAGDCTDGLYQQNNIAAGDGVKALEDIYLFLKTR